MKRATTWIVIADGCVAKIFSSRGGAAPWTPALELKHPEAASRSRQFQGDDGGVQAGEGAYKLSAMQPLSLKDVEAERFAEVVRDALLHGRSQKRFDALILVAAPRFLGFLRQKLTPALTQVLTGTLARDLTHLTTAQLPERVAAAT